MGKEGKRKPVLHTHVIDRLAFVNGILSGISMFPQALQVITTGQVAGVSIITSVIIWINSIVWLAYALHRGLVSITISSVLNVIASTLLLGALVTILLF